VHKLVSDIDQWSQALFESKQLSPSYVHNSVDNSNRRLRLKQDPWISYVNWFRNCDPWYTLKSTIEIQTLKFSRINTV
jgi:hypothetical protein